MTERGSRKRVLIPAVSALAALPLCVSLATPVGLLMHLYLAAALFVFALIPALLYLAFAKRRGTALAVTLAVAIQLAAPFFTMFLHGRNMEKAGNEGTQFVSSLRRGMSREEVDAAAARILKTWWRENRCTLPELAADGGNDYRCWHVSLHRDYQIDIAALFRSEDEGLAKALRIDFGDNGRRWIEAITGDGESLRYHAFEGIDGEGSVHVGELVEERF